jgi:hypothetical protein
VQKKGRFSLQGMSFGEKKNADGLRDIAMRTMTTLRNKFINNLA